MKKIITIFGIAALVFAGCSNPVENSIEPIITVSGSINKEMGFEMNTLTALPSELYIANQIDGKQGGKVILQGVYQNYYGDTVTVTATLEVPKDAFTGIKNISMRTDRYSPAMEFQPGGSFNKPLKLDLKFVGIKLSRYNLQDCKTDFFYIADNGTMVVIKNDGLNVNLAEKIADVKGAKLNHFSRYGFLRKSNNISSKFSAE